MPNASPRALTLSVDYRCYHPLYSVGDADQRSTNESSLVSGMTTALAFELKLFAAQIIASFAYQFFYMLPSQQLMLGMQVHARHLSDVRCKFGCTVCKINARLCR